MKSKSEMSARNKTFWAMDRTQKRIAVAKDVLKQLDSGLLTARKGTYLEFRKLRLQMINNLPNNLDKVFNLVSKKGATCDVCGIGSCFIATVRLGDDYETDKIFENNPLFTGLSLSSRQMRPYLRKIFTSRQLTLIECAFEQNYRHRDTTDKLSSYVFTQDVLEAVRFGLNYKNDEDRLRAIMYNIITNNGTFKP